MLSQSEILFLSGSGSKGQLLERQGGGSINIFLPVSFSEISKKGVLETKRSHYWRFVDIYGTQIMGGDVVMWACPPKCYKALPLFMFIFIQIN